MKIEKHLLSVREAAMISGMSVGWWRRQILLRRVAFIRVGGAVRIPVPVISAILASGTVPALDPLQ